MISCLFRNGGTVRRESAAGECGGTVRRERAAGPRGEAGNRCPPWCGGHAAAARPALRAENCPVMRREGRGVVIAVIVTGRPPRSRKTAQELQCHAATQG